MREISSDLLERVSKKLQTPFENADPKLRVIASKGFSKSLFDVYTIHESEDLGTISVTARRSNVQGEPDRLYLAYIDNGMAYVKSKPLPYDDLLPWEEEFSLGSAEDVAIEFNGYWARDPISKKYNLVAEEFPWVFSLVDGTLFAQYWQEDPIELATNVIRMSSVRGWVPVNGTNNTDQGLLIGYVKTDGTVWYRGYCVQPEVGSAWELEQQITAFSGLVIDVMLFRTNDFRVGFVVQNADNTVEFVVTDRNWAGMSFEAETFTFGMSPSAEMDITEIIPYDYTDAHVETITFGMNNHAVFNALEDGATPPVTVVSVFDAVVTGRHKVYLDFNVPLRWAFEDAGLGLTNLFPISSASIVGQRVYLETEQELETNGFSMTLGGYALIGQITSTYSAYYTGGLVIVRGDIAPHIETITFGMAVNPIFVATEITTYDYLGALAESITFAMSISATMVVTEVGTTPI